MPARRGGHRGAGPPPPLVPRLLPAGGAQQPAGHPRSDRDRDGRSFSARHVIAVQDGEVIFSMITSFHAESEGGVFDDAPRRNVPAPEDVAKGGWNTLLDVRPVTPTDFLKGVFTDCLWVRSATPLGEDPLMHRAALTYLSDLGTGFGQQDKTITGRGGPSVDHSMWFQENIRADDWVLVDLRPVKARARVGGTRLPAGPPRRPGCDHQPGAAPAAGVDVRIVEEALRQEAELAAKRGAGRRAISRSCNGPTGSTRPAARRPRGGVRPPSWRWSRCPAARSARRAAR